MTGNQEHLDSQIERVRGEDGEKNKNEDMLVSHLPSEGSDVVKKSKKKNKITAEYSTNNVSNYTRPVQAVDRDKTPPWRSARSSEHSHPKATRLSLASDELKHTQMHEKSDDHPVKEVETTFTSNIWDTENKSYGRAGLLFSRNKLDNLGLLPSPTGYDKLRVLHINRKNDKKKEKKNNKEDKNLKEGEKKDSENKDSEKEKETPKWGSPKIMHTIEGLGSTERCYNYGFVGAKWRIPYRGNNDVVVRKDIDMRSEKMGTFFPGHELRQRGPAEIFMDGEFCGLIRMPIQPEGWVTVDATSCNGPVYLEQVEEKVKRGRNYIYIQYLGYRK